MDLSILVECRMVLYQHWYVLLKVLEFIVKLVSLLFVKYINNLSNTQRDVIQIKRLSHMI